MDGLLSRITFDPPVCHNKPCVRGLRYPVETLLKLVSGGMTFDEVLADYEDLERDDLLERVAPPRSAIPRVSVCSGDGVFDGPT